MTKPVAYNGGENYIFISYSHRNTDFVWDTLNDLQKDGFRFWYDDGIEAGVCWDDYIAEHIEGSGYFIAFVSKEYAASDNCIQELRFAINLKKTILLVRMDGEKLTHGLEMRLCTYQNIKVYELEGPEYLEKIETADGIESYRPKQDAKAVRYSYKEDYPHLMKVMKQSCYCEALFVEHDLMDNILFWCIYNMGLLANPSSGRLRGKARDELEKLLCPADGAGEPLSFGIGTPEKKLELVAALYAWANSADTQPCEDAAFEVLRRQLCTERYAEYSELFAAIRTWCDDIRRETSDMLKHGKPMAEGAQASLAAKGGQCAQSLNEIYKELKKGGRVRKAFGLK